MNAPRPNTRLDNLLQEFKRLAEIGPVMPSITDIACAIGVSNSDFYRLLDAGHRKGLWELQRDGARIIGISGRGGKWSLTCSMRRYRDDPTLALSRICLRCREAFPSAHIGNRLCVTCNAYAVQAAP
jgi:hypothetical protein